MFEKLFTEGGLSLDRLRALVEVGSRGSILQAAGGDAVRQSQYSRQIKELEDFFRVRLAERHGRGVRLTPAGRELVRISRFFLMALSNFRRGCLAEEQLFRIGCSTTFLEKILLPLLSASGKRHAGVRYFLETVLEEEIERRLHDLTLDFAITTKPELSRPLQLAAIKTWGLKFWIPGRMSLKEAEALERFHEGTLPLILARDEMPRLDYPLIRDYEPYLTCNTFLQAEIALKAGAAATLLPDFFKPGEHPVAPRELRVAEITSPVFGYHLAWNPRLLRLNAHATGRRDFLLKSLAA